MRNIIKKLVLTLPILFFLVACGSGGESNVAADQINDAVSDIDQSSLVFKGTITGQNGYNTTGDLEIYFNADTNQYSLILDNFSSDSGPALFVYLSQGRFALNFQNLGALKALNGRLRYDVSADQFDPNFDHVLIWCDQVAQSFGEAMFSL